MNTITNQLLGGYEVDGCLVVTGMVSGFPVWDENNGFFIANDFVVQSSGGNFPDDLAQIPANIAIRIPTNMLVVTQVRTQVIFGELANSLLPLVPFAWTATAIFLFAALLVRFVLPRIRGDK